MRIAAIFLLSISCFGCGHLSVIQISSPSSSEAKAVVFDIDGTLTPDVYSFFQARADAAKTVQAFADKGYKIIYLSTRIRQLQAGIPRWLERHGFPESNVHVAQTDADHDNPDIYKTRILKEYRSAGWQLIYAYGDSSTDFIAYEAAGITKERVFALLREGKTSCEPGIWHECLRGWTEHLGFVVSTPPASSN